MDEYYTRIIDSILDDRMKFISGICLKGPKRCGKTTTAKRKAKTIYSLGKPSILEETKSLYALMPQKIFNDDSCPILFDEWQLIPELWDEGRAFIDESSQKGAKILLTGSALLSKETIKKSIHHSGIGRYISLIMRPMSLFESKESNGSISLESLFDPNFKLHDEKSSLTIERLLFAICRGGWPEAVTESDDNRALKISQYLYNAIKEREIDELIDFSGGKKNTKILELLLKSYAKNNSTLATNTTILKDIRFVFPSFSEPSFYSYKDYLDSMFIFEDVQSWSPIMKSRVNMRSNPKKEFIDPSLAICALNLSPEKLEKKLFDTVFFFENLVIRDLRIYAMKNEGEVYYYHDRNGLESDAVLVFNDGRYALIEIKLDENEWKKGEESLLKVKNEIIKYNENMKNESQIDKIMELPSSLIVITGGKHAATTTNGVHIVPIGCLKP